MYLVIAVMGGCYQENLPQVDLHGTVVLPVEAAQLSVVTLDGQGNVTDATPVDDARAIGPVFLGAFASMDTSSFSYPHPSMGPIVTSTQPGDTFPYGASSVGRFDFACYKFLACKISTGRFSSYADILDYFNNVVGNPIVDDHGYPVEASSTFQQQCYEYFYATADEEFSFIGDLDFTLTDAGYEADFVMPHTTLEPGMSLWGFMDAPVSKVDGYYTYSGFSTCNSSDGGNQHVQYDQDFYEGAPYPDILNYPSSYIRIGDWVADGQTTVNSADDDLVINLSVQVQE